MFAVGIVVIKSNEKERGKINKVSIQRHAPTNTDVSVVRATKHQSWMVIIYLFRIIADSFFNAIPTK
jgi:2-iminoacetate synthase ThiH